MSKYALAIVAALMLATAGWWFFAPKGRDIEGDIREFAAFALGADATTSGAYINNGKGKVRKLTVYNPTRKDEDKTVAGGVSRISFEISPQSSDDVWVLDSLVFDNVQVKYKGGLSDSNLGTMYRHLQRAVRSNEGDNLLATQKVVIHRLEVTGGKIIFPMVIQKKQQDDDLLIPAITVENIGLEEGGVTLSEAFMEISQAVMHSR